MVKLIRKARLEDVPQLVSLAVQMWKSHTTEDLTKNFCEHIRKGKNIIFLAISEEHIVGFAQCRLRFDYVEETDSSPVGYLEGIFVLEEYKKRGYAKELLGECKNWAKDQGCLEFASDCELNNEDSLKFHLKMGFAEANRIICFTKRLTDLEGEYVMAKNYEYKKATIADIDELVRTRIIVLRTANKLSNDVDMSLVEKESYDYYKSALETGEHIAYLVYDNETFIGAGGVSFYNVMPTYHNPTGKKAYIMNIYTASEYRRQGIAFHTLDLLVKDVRKQGISQITLEATEMGRPLYEKYGFVKMEDEMELIK